MEAVANVTTTPPLVRPNIARSPAPNTPIVSTSPFSRPSSRLAAIAVRSCALALLAATLLLSTALAEMPAFRWASRGGGPGHDYGTGITVDNEGNTYVCGYFRSQARFEEYSLAGKGEADIFLAKYNRTGKLEWVRQAGGSADDFARAVAIDAEGNCYLTGSFQSPTVDFGGEIVKRNSDTEIFVTKFDGNGKVLWVRQAGGTGGLSAGGSAFGDGTAATQDVFTILANLTAQVQVRNVAGFANIEAEIVNLDLATEQVIEARAQTGIALSRFEAAFNVNEFMQERVPAYLADIQDADMTEAIAELQLTSTALEATLSATGKVLNGPSLLDYLR